MSGSCLCRSDAQRNAVLNHGIVLENPIQIFAWRSAVDHVVFRDDLKKIHLGAIGNDVCNVRHTKSNADPQVLSAIGHDCVPISDPKSYSSTRQCHDPALK